VRVQQRVVGGVDLGPNAVVPLLCGDPGVQLLEDVRERAVDECAVEIEADDRRGADHRVPSTMPSMNCRDIVTNRMTIGIAASVRPANRRAHSVRNSAITVDRPSGSVLLPSLLIMTRGKKNSFQILTEVTIATVPSAGRINGRKTDV